MSTNIKDQYSKLLQEAGLFAYGTTKGSFILPPQGYALWQNIKKVLNHKFARYGVQNVLFPTLIPEDLLTREQSHVAGFRPECYYVERVGEKKLSAPLILRPTSEVAFLEWYRQILHSYSQLPLLYNQWCSVFRAEKNTAPFFRNTEFLWQEGHTLHSSEEEARQLTLNIWAEYKDYAENILGLGIIAGRKTEGEKFAGAQETYTVECLLPDGQCLQLATSHYFRDNFCRLMGIKFQGSDPKKPLQFPFSTSWGTSTRAIGAIAKTHADEWGVILPFLVAPTQIAFILIEKSEKLINYYREISSLLVPHYRCRLYAQNSQVNLNFLQADKEGCPLKIILGNGELEKKEITLTRRDNIERRITISLVESESEKKTLEDYAKKLTKLNPANKNKEELEKEVEQLINSFRQGFWQEKIHRVIVKEAIEFQKNLSQKSANWRDQHIFKVNNLAELEKSIEEEGKKGLFLLPFCNQLECEKKIKEREGKVSAYSVRCILENQKINLSEKCLFCQTPAQNLVYLGRSY